MTKDIDTVLSRHWETCYLDGGDVDMQKLLDELRDIVCVKAIAQKGIGEVGQGVGVYLYIPLSLKIATGFVQQIQRKERKSG